MKRRPRQTKKSTKKRATKKPVKKANLRGPEAELKEFSDYPPMLRPEEVQRILRISRSSFFRLVESRSIPGLVRVGGSWRVDRDVLRSWIGTRANHQDCGYWVFAGDGKFVAWETDHSGDTISRIIRQPPQDSLVGAVRIVLDHHRKEGGDPVPQVIRLKNSQEPIDIEIGGHIVKVQAWDELPLVAVSRGSRDPNLELYSKPFERVDQMGKITSVKLTLSKEETAKLTAKEMKRFLMLTCILRDLVRLQKHLVFVCNLPKATDPVTAAATETDTLVLVTTLASKIHEMWTFLKRNGIVGDRPNLPSRVKTELDRVQAVFKDKKVEAIFSFIRNKFGFHYEYEDDIDKKIEAVIDDIDHLELWLSSGESGNDIFASSDVIVRTVITREMALLDFPGDDKKLVATLFDRVLEAARYLANFSRAYLAEVIVVQWKQEDEQELDVPLISDVTLPLLVAPDDP